jgi:uncharacterized OsmC-like protein
MSSQERIKSTSERNERALGLKSTLGQGTAVTKARILEGLTCEVEEGPWKLTVDMSEKSGGNNSGPNPGILGRGALGSCLAISYAMWAARLGVPVQSLEVEIHADYDSRGMYGVDGVSPGYKGIRYLVKIETTAQESEVLAMMDQADAHSPYLSVFSEPQDLNREVRIMMPGRVAP